MSPPGPALSIGELAAATGVAPGTLRMWETRHGFPQPMREGRGDRRYGPDDVARVARVTRERERGLSLAAAIDRVRHWTPGAAPSLFSALRQAQPELEPRHLRVPAMLALSRAIEDECLARAARPVLAATFQTARAYRAARHRWVDLARTAALTVVLADFPAGENQGRGAPLEPVKVRLEPSSPVGREWAIACVDERLTACLAGWEQPVDDRPRRFEMVWSTDAEAVTATLRAALGLARPQLPDAAASVLDALPTGGGGPDATLALANRMVGYLAEAVDSGGSRSSPLRPPPSRRQP